jgi:ABC-2 type transport system ATP-binding protein
MPVLSIENLVKSYGRVRALRGVSFSVAPGEVFGYLGPNGAGKTTTLRILLGLVHPTGGRALLFGKSPSRAEVRARTGYLPGELALYGDMTGEGLLDHYAGFRPGRPAPLRPVLVEALGVERPALTGRAKFLSHGTRQKLGLIIAMQHDPELLLLDEPTTGFDPLVQKAFRGLVLDAARRGRSVVFSSHVLSEVEAVCGRVAILREGELVTVEAIESLRERMVRQLRVRFRKSVPDGLEATPGVTRAEVEGKSAILWVRGDVNPVLRRIAREEVERFVFPEPELEDIFLTYYKREAESR